MVFWRLKCVSPGFAGPSGFGCAGLAFLQSVALCLYRVLRVCYGTLLCILWLDNKWFSSLPSVCFDA